MDCSGGDEVNLETGTLRKLEAMMQALQRRDAARVLVFCNKIETCRRVENHLRRTDREGRRWGNSAGNSLHLPSSIFSSSLTVNPFSFPSFLRACA